MGAREDVSKLRDLRYPADALSYRSAQQSPVRPAEPRSASRAPFCPAEPHGTDPHILRYVSVAKIYFQVHHGGDAAAVTFAATAAAVAATAAAAATVTAVTIAAAATVTAVTVAATAVAAATITAVTVAVDVCG